MPRPSAGWRLVPVRRFLAGVAVGLVPYAVYRGMHLYLLRVYDKNGEQRAAVQEFLEERYGES